MKNRKMPEVFRPKFSFFSILIDRKFENWIMICNFWQFLLISVWIKKWMKAYISSIFPLFPCKKVTKFDHFLTPSTYFTSSQMLITKETAKKLQHVTQLACLFPAKFQSGQFAVTVTRSHGSWALKTIRLVERREEDSDGRGWSPNKQNLVRI